MFPAESVVRKYLYCASGTGFQDHLPMALGNEGR